MRTHDKKNGEFWGILKLEKFAPKDHTAITREVDPPYRVCDKTYIRRVFNTRWAIARGKWGPRQDTVTGHLAAAVAFEEIFKHGRKWQHPDYAGKIRT